MAYRPPKESYHITAEDMVVAEEVGQYGDPSCDKQQGLPGVENPKAGHVHLNVITQLYGVTERSVQLWAERGWIPKGIEGMYNLRAVVRGIYQAQLELINKKKGPEGAELDNLELREQKAKTGLAELELERKRGLVVPVEEVKRAAFEKGQSVKAAIATIPSRVAAILAAETDTHKVREILTEELTKALEELAR